MKKLHNAKWFILGVVVTILVVGFVIPAAAAPRHWQATLTYRDIKVVLDGRQLNIATEPFLIDGTTYLPLRPISEALGLTTNWDGATNTVTLTSGGFAEIAPPIGILPPGTNFGP